MPTTRSRTKSSKSTAARSAGGGTKGKGAGSKSAGGGSRRGSAKRTLMNTGTDKRYVRRDAKGHIKESDDVGRSLSADRRKKAKTVSKPGQGDKGDRKPSTSKSRA